MRFWPNRFPRRALVFPAAAIASCCGASGGETFAARLAERIGADRLALWPEAEVSARVPPPVTGVVPEAPEEEDFFDRLELSPARAVSVRPTGSPWFLPRPLGTNKTGDLPGPGVGFSLNWRPSKSWRFGADLIVRAERVDEDNRLHDWTPYLAPGVEFLPYPNARRPFSLGLVAPWAERTPGGSWAGLFVVVRWSEPLNRPPRARR